MQYCTASLTAIPSFLPPGSDRAFHRLHLTRQTAQSRNAKSELVPYSLRISHKVLQNRRMAPSRLVKTSLSQRLVRPRSCTGGAAVARTSSHLLPCIRRSLMSPRFAARSQQASLSGDKVQGGGLDIVSKLKLNAGHH